MLIINEMMPNYAIKNAVNLADGGRTRTPSGTSTSQPQQPTNSNPCASFESNVQSKKTIYDEKEEIYNDYLSASSLISNEVQDLENISQMIDSKGVAAVDKCGKIAGKSIDNKDILSQCKTDLSTYSSALSALESQVKNLLETAEREKNDAQSAYNDAVTEKSSHGC